MDLATKRSIFRTHRAALEQWLGDDGTGVVHQWMVENYAESMLMGLRRILDKDRRTLSFVKLLEDLDKNHSSLSMTRYLELWQRTKPARDAALAPRVYARFSRDGRSFDRGQIQADLKKLDDDHKDIHAYINTVIAHREDSERNNPSDGPRPEVTWEHLDRLFDDICALFNKYYSLVDPGAHIDFVRVLPAGYEQAFVRMLAGDRRKAQQPAEERAASAGRPDASAARSSG